MLIRRHTRTELNKIVAEKVRQGYVVVKRGVERYPTQFTVKEVYWVVVTKRPRVEDS